MKRLVLLALVLACGGSSGSNTGNVLNGTLSQDLNLGYDSVSTLDLTTQRAFELRYLKSADAIFDLLVHADGLDLTQPITIDLAQVVNGVPRGLATRAVSGDARHVFPTIATGSIIFAQAPRLNTTVAGTFTIQFAATGGDVGAGRTVSGSFSGTLTQQ